MGPMRSARRRLPPLLVSLSLAAAPVAAQAPPTSWTITVDCQAGQRINDALEQAAPELVVEVRGECVENVVIRRDRVTLRGLDPARDGIRSAGTDDPHESSVLIRGARRVTIANLRISGAARDGLRVLDSQDDIRVLNSSLESNGVWGASIVDSTVAISETSFLGNGFLAGDRIGGGLIAARGSNVSCTGCVIESNPQEGVNLGAVAFTGSLLKLVGGAVGGETALLAQSHAAAEADGTELTGATWAFQANSYGEVRLLGSPFAGPFLGMTYSTIELLGATQLLNPTQNFVSESSTLVVDRLDAERTAALNGFTLVTDFSTGRVVNGSFAGELVCGLGGEVYCDGTELKTAVLGCGLCP